MNTQHVLIETLTPLHIGSGRFLQGNTEYLYFQDTCTVAVVDERKILDIIGEAQIDVWISLISKGDDLLDYIRKRRPGVRPADAGRRLLSVLGKRSPGGNQTIREQIFSGNGQPILPGSSLKGAIRTAVLNALIQDKPEDSRKINQFKVTDLGGNVKYKGSKLEKKYLGEDPNHDVFRLLRIGDAHFDKTVCILSETLNEKQDNSFEMKESVRQFIECIPAGAETLCRVQIPSELKTRLSEPRYSNVADKIPHRDRMNWKQILADINTNTKRLIQNELNRYQSQHLPNGANEYLDSLSGLMNELRPNQCVIRVGFGTGYLNMTGGWPEEQWAKALPKEKFDAEMVDLSQAVRHDQRGNYNYWSHILPKSRKMVLDGVPLGFLKLTLFSEGEFTEWQGQSVRREAVKAAQAEAARVEALRQTEEIETARLAQEEAARQQAEEARKPKLFDGTLKMNQELDAEIMVSAKTNRVKVYAAGYESRQFDLIGYSGAEPVGKVVIVNVDQLDKKKNLTQIRYVKPK